MKYMPMIAPIVIALAIVIIVYGLWTYGIAEMIRTFAQTSDNLMKAAEIIANSGRQVVN